jgi:arachidonate 15-lipoxygenase
LRRNWERLIRDEGYSFEEDLPQKTPVEIAEILVQQDLLSILGYGDPDLGVALSHKRPSTFTEYLRLFKQIPIPQKATTLYDDGAFADYFVSGLNPLMVTRLSEIPEKLALNDSVFRQHRLFSSDSLDDALADERAFIVDYALLDSLEPGKHPDQDKYVYAPIVVLAIPKQGERLEVLGIQYGQNPSLYPFVTPSDNPWSWQIAKTMVKVADINYHEVASHLCLTHLVVEPIVVATYRQLSSRHPVHKLLAPHFEGTIPINALAVNRLINKGGKVEQLATSKIDSAYRVIEAVREGFHFRDSFLSAQLARRGVDATSQIKEYPYRDDALLIWGAIENWVTNYVKVYYSSDDEILLDGELQHWAQEIQDPDMGRIQGFLPTDGMASRQTLAETLTMIIFTASAQHAAVNFPQREAAAVPYQPLGGYAPAPSHLNHTEKDAVDFLPPLDRAIKQTHTLSLLGQIYHTQLGQYAPGTFFHPQILLHQYRFTDELKSIEKTIKARNRTRRTPYEHLKPSRIPQSINI